MNQAPPGVTSRDLIPYIFLACVLFRLYLYLPFWASLWITVLALVVCVAYCPDTSAVESRKRLGSKRSIFWPVGGNKANTTTILSQVHVRRWGSPGDIAVVCLHGTFTSSHEFEEWAESLQQSIGEESIEVFAVDLPGHGLTGPWTTPDRRASPYSIEADVAFVGHFLEQSELMNKRIILVGHSIGGSIAARFTSQNPERVAGLVLVAPWGLRHGSRDPSVQHCVWFVKFVISPRWRFLNLWLVLMMVRVTPKFLVRYALGTAFGPGAIDAGELAPRREKITAAADRMQSFMLREGNRPTFVKRISEFVAQEKCASEEMARCRAELEMITCPVQVQWGEADSWLHIGRCDAWAESLSNAAALDVRTWPGVGHCVPEQTPQRSADAAWSFIQKNFVTSSTNPSQVARAGGS